MPPKVLSWVFCLGVLSFGTPSSGAPGDLILRLDAVALRLNALSAPLPQYPATALTASRQGLVVVSVRVTSDGRVERVDRVEAFDEEGVVAVRRAVSQWRFKPLPPGNVARNAPRLGELIFYFRLRNGRATVIDAAAEALRNRRQ